MSIGAMLEPPVAKNPPDDKPPYVAPTDNVRLDRDLVEMARLVIAHRKKGGNKLNMTDYLGSLVRDQITKDHDEVLAEITATQQSRKKPKGEG